MSILSDLKIIEAVKRGDIYISDFDPKREYDGNGKYKGRLGPNGYDLTLNKKLLVYKQFPLDMKIDNPVEEVIIPPEGLVLQPGIIYLGKTNEYTMTNNYVPFLESRSSLARLGMGCHYFSGYGDVGFQGYWTLEITVIHPTRVYADTSVCQISYNTVEGEVGKKYNGKYQGSKDVLSSMIYKDEIFDNNKSNNTQDDYKTLSKEVFSPFSLIDKNTLSLLREQMSNICEQYKNDIIKSVLSNENGKTDNLNDSVIKEYLKPIISIIKNDLKNSNERIQALNNIQHIIEIFAREEGFELSKPSINLCDYNSFINSYTPPLHSYYQPTTMKFESNNVDDEKEENTISVEFKGFPNISESVNKKAKEAIEYLSSSIDNENVSIEINENIHPLASPIPYIKRILIQFSKFVGDDFKIIYSDKEEIEVSELIESIKSIILKNDKPHIVFKEYVFEYKSFVSRTLDFIKNHLKTIVINKIFTSKNKEIHIKDIFNEDVTLYNQLASKRIWSNLEIILNKEFIVKFNDYCYVYLKNILKKGEL